MGVDFSGMDRAIALSFGGQVQAIADQLAEATPDALKTSQQSPVFNELGTQALITWASPVALLIHEGNTGVDGTVAGPNRWTEQVLT